MNRRIAAHPLANPLRCLKHRRMIAPTEEMADPNAGMVGQQHGQPHRFLPRPDMGAEPRAQSIRLAHDGRINAVLAGDTALDIGDEDHSSTAVNSSRGRVE
jgi:hypothetical protein